MKAVEPFRPNDHSVYDEDDNVLEADIMRKTPRDIRPLAKRLATERKKIVFIYADNGREAIDPDPTIDCPATLCYYTDRHAGTVIAISASGRKITIREDKAVRVDTNDMSESQRYDYERDPDGRTHVCYLRKDGRYYSNQGPRVILGIRNAYHDYGF